jgi:hypothetical protein
MAGFIVCIAIIAIFMLCLYYERKDKARKGRQDWICDCRQHLVRITHSFHRECQTIAETAFTRYTNIILHNSYRHMPDYMTYSFLSDYRETINNLEADYIDNLAERYADGNEKQNVYDLPDYLIGEYEKTISDIASDFCDFAYLMRKHIDEAKEIN